MSRTAKALLIAGALFVLGIVIGGIGFLSGGVDALEENYGVNPVANSRSFSEPVRKLEISTTDDDVVLLPAEDGLCRVDWKDTRFGYYEVSLENGTLEIRYRSTGRIISFHFSESEPCTVAVYLPEGAYESLSVATTDGSFVSSGFSFGETEITTTDGSVGLGSGDFGEAKITTTDGDVVLDGYDAERTEITTTDGSVIGTVATPQTYHVHSTNGEVECPQDVPGGGIFEVHTTDGGVKLSAAK